MKRIVLLAITILSICLTACNKKKWVDTECSDSALEEEKHEQEIEYLHGEYDVLCHIGMDKWGSFERFYEFIENDSNKICLNKELEDGGWWGLFDLDYSYYKYKNDFYYWDTTVLEYNFDMYSNIQYNDEYIKYLYLSLIDNTHNSTLKDFKQELKKMNGFVKYYKHALEIGIVNNWEQFIMFMFVPNCNYCECDKEHIDDDNW